jgi:hypothetical protein
MRSFLQVFHKATNVVMAMKVRYAHILLRHGSHPIFLFRFQNYAFLTYTQWRLFACSVSFDHLTGN